MKYVFLLALICAAALSGCRSGPDPVSCDRDNGGCDSNAICAQRTDSVLCICNPSYVGSGYSCVKTGLQAGASWPAEAGNAARSGQSIYVGSQTGTLAWRFPTDNAGLISSIWLSPPVVGADGTAYIGCSDGKVYAIAPDGGSKWTFDVGLSEHRWSTAAIAEDGMLYVEGATSGTLYAIDTMAAAGNAAAKWSLDTGDVNGGSSPVIGGDGTIYIGSADGMGNSGGKLYAINPDMTTKWFFDAERWPDTSPALGPDGTIYIGTDCTVAADCMALYAVDSGGNFRWAYSRNGSARILSPAIGPDGTVYALFHDASGAMLFAFDPQPIGTDATIKWQWALPAGSGMSNTLAVGADGTVYVAADDEVLYALDANAMARGGATPKWSFKGSNGQFGSIAIGADGTAYVADNFRIHAIRDGALVWSYPPEDLGSFFLTTPAIAADGTVYVSGYDGYLYAFRD